jgi:hypothetical protein
MPPVVIVPSGPKHLSLVKVISSMVITTNLAVNRMAGWLEGSMFEMKGETGFVNAFHFCDVCIIDMTN